MATTLSLIAIFVPVGFMGGIVGRFMKSFGLTMSFAIMVSLLVSFTLTPMLSARWIKMRRGVRMPTARGGGSGSKESRFFRPVDVGYSQAAVVGAGAPRGGGRAGRAGAAEQRAALHGGEQELPPNDDQSEFEIGLRAPEGTSLDATELIANRIADGRPPAAGGRLHAGDRSRTIRRRRRTRERSTCG